MKKNLFLLLLIAPLFLVQCCKKKKATATETEMSETKPVEVQPSTEIKLLPITIQKDFTFTETDQFTVISSGCNGDTLLVEVEYGGGCEEHVFTMVSNNLWLKSMPPQLTLYLQHENNNDMCRAMIRTTLRFDLKEVRFPGGKEMKLYINNDRSRETIYKY